MKVSGFTFIRNGVKYDYPFIESIRSILPICDEVVVAVGRSDDHTLEMIEKINNPKIKIIETVWDETLREGGRVLADETNKALNAISADSHWAFYVQADEVFHEQDLEAIRQAMIRYKDDKRVEGLLFRHVNFFGSYDYVADSHKWVKDEIRIIRNDKNIRSWKDAMSFRNGEKVLYVKKIDATIYHYGWVKDPRTQMEKRKEFEKLWHDDAWVEKNVAVADEFDYQHIDVLSEFNGTHPAVMLDRIERVNWKFSFNPVKAMRVSLRIRFLNFVYRHTGWNIGQFKNYKEI
ncbi:MAG: glycosyltransferase family 2 protein [Bacteroidota bacterium]